MYRKIIVFICVIGLLACKKEKAEDPDNKILGEEQVTFIINKLPENHDFESDVFISGDFEGWSGGREQFKLQRKGNQYQISIPKYKESFSFKFTKGNWDSVECALDGNPIENRTYTYHGKDENLEIKILNWQSETQKETPSTASENVYLFDEEFDMVPIKRKRKVSIYLPPDYQDTQKRFPVLYIQDGQNVFDLKTSYSGEWEVDETLNHLHDTKGFGLIVVAVDHGGDKRFNEYSPWDNKRYGVGEGELYVEFLVKTLKPAIDSAYRTKPEAENTAVMGSSLGGLISHYVAFKYPNVFGKASIFSPSYWYAEKCYDFTQTRIEASKTSKIYLLAGEKEDEDLLEEINKMVDLLKVNGFPQSQLSVKIDEDGTHSESFWKQEFEQAISWLFDVK